MKKILLSAVMLYSIAFAQNCEFRINEVDEFTKKVKKATKFRKVGASDVGYLKSSIARIDELKAFYFIFSQDLGCLSYDSYAIIKFIDGKTLEIKNIADTDCSDTPTFIGFIKDENLSSLPIEKIRLGYSDYYTDITIKEQTFFITDLNCVK